jgi:hypothetical protein
MRGPCRRAPADCRRGKRPESRNSHETTVSIPQGTMACGQQTSIASRGRAWPRSGKPAAWRTTVPLGPPGAVVTCLRQSCAERAQMSPRALYVLHNDQVQGAFHFQITLQWHRGEEGVDPRCPRLGATPTRALRMRARGAPSGKSRVRGTSFTRSTCLSTVLTVGQVWLALLGPSSARC